MTKFSFPAADHIHYIWERFVVIGLLALLSTFYSYSPAIAQDAPVDPPIAVAGPDIFTDFGATVRLDGSASISPDGTPLLYRWTETISGTVVGNGPVIDYIVLDGGFTDLTLSVSYAGGPAVTDEVTVSTQSVVPIANAGQDRTIVVGDTIRLDGSKSEDQTGLKLTYVWTLVEAPEDSTATFSDANAIRPAFTPDLEGLYSFDLNVANENGRLSEPSRLTLSTANSSPTASAGPDRIVNIGEVSFFDPQGTVDSDGDALTANWTLIHAPTGSSAVLEETEGGRFALLPDASGAYVVQVEISDSMGTSYDHAVLLVGAAGDVNVPPSANAGRDQSIVGTPSILLDGSLSSDVDGDLLDYSWAILSAPSTSQATLNNADQPAATFTSSGIGTYVVQLTVKDAFGGVDRDVVLVTTDDLSAQAIMGPDASIVEGATTVDSSLSAASNNSNTTYNWSALGLTGPEANIATPDQLITDVTFARQGSGTLIHPESVLGLEVLQKYSLFTTYDHYAKASIQGRAAIGGKSKGGYSRYGTGLGDTTGTDVLSVQKGLYWGWRKAHGGGNIRTGGRVRARAFTHHPGRVIYDRHLEFWTETESVRKLSHELADLPATSDYAWVGPRSHGVISLPAVPDNSGVAVFHFENAASLLSNHSVRKIKLDANGADTIVINVANGHVGVYKPHLIGDFLDRATASKVIWNFHEASRLKIYKPLVGSVLAPYAHTSMYAPVKGSVAVKTLSQYADIHLPVFRGDGLAPTQGEDPVKLSLLQLAASNTFGFAPDYATTLVTVGNLRPVGVLTSSTSNGGVVEPGEVITFDSAFSRDDGQNGLQRQWSILRAPDGAVLPEGDALSAVSLELTPELSGDYIVQLIVTDGELTSKPKTYRVRIENEPPIANAGEDQNSLKDNLVAFDGTGSIDPEGNELNYLWTIASAPDDSTAILTNANTATPSFTPEIPGVYEINLIVSDGILESEADSVFITIENRAPIAVATGMTEGFAGEIIMVSGQQSTDADDDPLAYTWSIAGPDGSVAQFTDPFIVAPSFVPDLGGVYTLSLVVIDGFAESEPATLILDISGANRPPILEPVGDKSVALGSTLTLALSAADPDGDQVYYAASPLPLPSGASFDVNTGTFQFAPTSLLPSSFSLSVSASDGSLNDSETFRIEVTNDNVSSTTDYTGRIVDSNTGNPVAGVMVMVGTQSVLTDANGVFILTDLEPGQNAVWIVANANTDLTTDGRAYGSTQISTRLIENVNNIAAEDIRVSPISSSEQAVPGEALTITNDALGVVLSVSADGVLGTGVESRYWRLFVNGITDPAEAISLAEWELSEGPGGDNLLQNGQASASSLFNSGFAAENAFDGALSTGWASTNGNSSNEWLAYDLGAGNEINVSETTIIVRGTPRSPNQTPTDFDIQISDDGQNWTTVRNVQTSPDWVTSESRSFSFGQPYDGPIGITAITAEQANALPPNIIPCQMFSLEPKTLRFAKPVTLTINNYDNLPAGAIVDVWVFADGEFNKRGIGNVIADGSKVEASLQGIPGGALIALAPRPQSIVTSIDQSNTTYIPSLLGEGNYSTAISLPGYSSNGASRGLSLVYNSTAAAPEPIVNANLTLGEIAPESLSSRVVIGGVDYGMETSVDSSQAGAGEQIRQSIQIGSVSLQTGVNSYQFISISEYACSKVEQVTEGKIFVDSQVDSPFGQGWSLAELSRIYPQEDGSVLIRDGNGTLTNFQSQTDFSTLGDPVQLPAVGPFRGDAIDIDGDGDQDIYWLVPEQGGVLLYENLGDKEFEFRSLVEVGRVVDVPPSGSFVPDVTQIGFGDFNADGLIDIAFGSQLSDDTTVVYAEATPFQFGSPIKLENRDSRSLAVGDFNSDGLDDFVTFGTGFAIPQLFSGSSLGNPIQSAASGGSTNLLGSLVADYNGDGIVDIVSRSGSRLESWRGRAGQVPIRDLNIPGLFPRFLGNNLGVSDVNGDGLQDILASSSRDGLQIYAQQSDGDFTLIGALDVDGTSVGSREFALRDINADGLDDIVIAQGMRVITFFNDPDGLFMEADIVDVGFNVGSARLADFNQDGSVDVIVDSQAQDALFVYFSDPSRSERFVDPLNDYTELTRNTDGSYQRRYNDGTTLAYSVEGLHTSTTDSNGNVTAYTYDAEDRVIRITDPVGLFTTFEYGTNGKLTQITYPDGRTSNWTYNNAGQLIRSEDVNGDVSLHGYDAQGRMTAKTDPRGLTTEILYGPAGRYAGSTLPDGTELKIQLAKTLGLPDLGGGEFTPGSATTTEVQDGRGNITQTKVNDFGSPLEITDPLGRITRYERDANNNVIAIDAPSSVTGDQRLRTEIDYDDQGNVIAKREAVGTSLTREMTYTYEPVFNKMIAMTDYDGFETTRTYDAFGNMLTETDPLGGVMSMTYDGRGLPTSRTDKNDNLTQLTYDNRGLPVTTIDPSGTVSEYSYDDAGNLLTQIDDFGGTLSREMSYTYDEKNRVLTQTAADGGVTAYAYDGNDNVISTTDPTGIVETRSYDDRDRLQTINDPASGTTVFTYDEDSNILRMTDALSETTEFTYDAVDRLLSSIDAKGQLRAFAYDSRDNITAVTDARANMTFMGYDALDRPNARTNPKGEQWNFAYDARDNRTSATKPDGVVLNSEYDALSRLTRIVGGDIERTYSYDAQSNLLAANDNLNGAPGPDLGFTYDGENRLGTASVANLFGNAAQNNVFTYGYDALDRRAGMADSFGGNTAYAYDPVDRLTQVTTPQGEVFTTNYDLAGRMLGRAAPNTTVTTRSYEDGTGRLASQTQAASDTAFNGFTYDYTDRGNLAKIAETGTVARTKRYSYDELERLTKVAVPEAPTQDETYTLDPEGNRLSSHLSGTGETDVANRLTGDDAYSYVYDLNGNLLSKTAKPGVTRPDWAYDYDDLDQLISVSRDGVEVERYRYDAFGRRSVIETANDPGSEAGAGNAVFERTAIVNDGSDRTIDLVQVDDGAGGAGTPQIQNRYTHGGQVDEPLSLEVFTTGGTLDQSYTYHADHLGSIRFVTDSVGTIVNAYEYDSYGRPGFEVEQVAQPIKYTGREWDETTGLYYYRSRYYEAETGKFIQDDPIRFVSGDYNFSRYVANNPINATDPTGLSMAMTYSENASGSLSLAPGAAVVACALNTQLTGIASAVAGAGSGSYMGISGSGNLCEGKANYKPKETPIVITGGPDCNEGGRFDRDVNEAKKMTTPDGRKLLQCKASLSRGQNSLIMTNLLRELGFRQIRNDVCYGGKTDAGHKFREERLASKARKCARIIASQSF